MKTYFRDLPLYSYFKDKNNTVYQQIAHDIVQDVKLGISYSYLNNPEVTHLFNVPVVTNKFIEYRNENGKCHRTDGPALVYKHGTKYWYINGKQHREDGPAVEYANGEVEYWFHDELYKTLLEYQVAVELFKQKQLTLA